MRGRCSQRGLTPEPSAKTAKPIAHSILTLVLRRHILPDVKRQARRLTLALAIAAIALPLRASEIRVSLLNNATVLNETAELLLQNGSSSESVEAFRKVVLFHKTDLFDTSRLPKEKSGFYHFKNVEELNEAIPDPFCEKTTTNDLTHNTLNCLDVVVLLIKDTQAKAPRLRENFAAKCFAKYQNRGSEETPDFVVNPVTSRSFYQDGRTLLYPTNGYTVITGLTRSANEVDLAISLKGERLLPGEFEDTDQAIRKLFAIWNSLREKDGLRFPEKIEVVSCGYIPMCFRYWAIDHVAVYVESGGKLVYLEKNGPRGPFLRIDFNDEKELGEFVANKLLPASRNLKEINYGSPVFVSINNRLIHIARPKSQPKVKQG